MRPLWMERKEDFPHNKANGQVSGILLKALENKRSTMTNQQAEFGALLFPKVQSLKRTYRDKSNRANSDSYV